MLLDLIQPNNTNTFNIKLAHTVGLTSAIYCNEILNILGKVVKKNKFYDDGFFRVSRSYVEERTTLTPEEQINIDVGLSKINLITRHKDDKDLIKLDINLLSEIVTNNDIELSQDLKKKTRLKNSKESRETKKETIIKRLKSNISCSNEELSNALYNWVDSIYANPTGWLSKDAVVTFQNTLNNYTKGNLDLALAIVSIATIQGFKDCNQAIRWYQRDQISNNQINQTKLNQVRKTDQVVANPDELSQEVF